MIRGIVQSVVEGVIKRFSGSGRASETITDREYIQHYGYTSRPLAGAEAVIINEGNHFIMVASDDRRYRIAIEAGEVCIYTDEGDHIRFKRGKEIYIESGNKLNAVIENEVDVVTKVANVTATDEVNVTTKTANVTASDHVTVTSPNVNVIASTKITCTTPELEVTGIVRVGGGIWAGINGTGDIHATGNVYDGVRSMAADRVIYNGHVHGGIYRGAGSTNTPTQQE